MPPARFRPACRALVAIALAGALTGAAPARAADEAELSNQSDSKPWWREVDLRFRGPLVDWHVYQKDGLRVEAGDDSLKLKFNASVWADGGATRTNAATERAFPGYEGSPIRLTRARVTMRGWVRDAGDFKIQLELAQRPQIKDMWFRLEPLPWVGRLSFGNMREPYSLENSTSGSNLTFATRALPALALAPGRNIGLAAANAALDGRLRWSAGWFWNTASFADFAGAKDALTNSIGNAIVARVTGLPRDADEGRSLTHLGLSLTRQWFSDEIRLRAVPETLLRDESLVDTGRFRPERAIQVTPEFAMVSGPWSIQAEYFHSFMKLPEGASAAAKGLYGFVSYVITGESRSYDRAAGVFDGVRPKRKLDWGTGGWGAWEAALRLSRVDLSDGPLAGGRETNVAAALNWYTGGHARMTVEYVAGRVNGRTANPAIDGGRVSVLQARLAVDF